jgi:glycosyltransferase involved in cell wall biosynthesis
MIRLKNVSTLVRAFAQVACQFPAAQLRLAGSHQDSSYARECWQLAVGLGVADRVKFLGLLTISQMQEELASASIVALCSLEENAPLAIAEAMAAGVPLLASAVGGIPWMVMDGVTGRLVEPMDVASVSSGLRQMLIADDLDRMGRASKQKAETTYRASTVALQTIQVYSEVLKRSKRSRV